MSEPASSSSIGSDTMFTSHGLPPNSELHRLPPLPDTPIRSSFHSLDDISSCEDALNTLSRTTSFTSLPTSTRKPTLNDIDLSSDAPEPRQLPREDSWTEMKAPGNRKWEVEVDYPVLSTRQGGAIPPVGRTPSRDYLRDVSYTSTKKVKAVETGDRGGCLDVHVGEGSLAVAIPRSKSMEMESETSCRIEVPSEPFSALTTAPQSQVELSLQSPPPAYPDQRLEPPSKVRPDSPHVAPFDSPVEHRPQPQPRISASFNLPTGADASLIADASLFGGAASSTGDDSFEFGINKLRQFPPSFNLNTALDDNDGPGSSGSSRGSNCDTPTKPYSVRAFPQQHDDHDRLDQSTLLPRSHGKSAHLLASTNALSNVKPPWSADESDVFSSSNSTIDSRLSPERGSVSPEKMQGPLHSQNMRGFPAATSSNSSNSVIPSAAKGKRIFPASSSGQSLASVGEEFEYPAAGDVSTLLPVSPVKAAHLLTDAELIAKETLVEEASFRLSLPPRTTPFRSATIAHHTPRRSPARYSPLKTAFRGNLDEGDVTLDVKDLMAKVGKPKRASGTEESFVDLLHDDFMPDDLDASMMGPDESMLHPSLRPRSTRMARASPTKPHSTLSPNRPTYRIPEEPSTVKRLPTSQQSRVLSGHGEDGSGRPAGTGVGQSPISRSKSLSRVAEIIQRVRSDRAQAALANEEGHQQQSPPKTAIRARTYTTARTPAAPAVTPGLPKPRSSIMPSATVTSRRRISLSVGAIPLPTNASLKTIELSHSPSRSTHARTASTSSQPAVGAPSALKLEPESAAEITSLPASRAHQPTRETRETGRTDSTTARARSSIAPTSRMEPRARTGSTTSIASGSAALPSASTARATTTTRQAFRPTSTSAGRTTAAVSSSSLLTRPSGSSARAALPGLPQPGTGPTARSAPSSRTTTSGTTTTTAVEARARMSRGFGTDATSATNRLPRPSIAGVSKSGLGTKSSLGPAAAASSRSTIAKTRALSTPASAVTSTGSGRVPPVPTVGSRVGRDRPSLAPRAGAGTSTSSSTRDLPKPPTSRLPGASSTAYTQRVRGSSTLPPALPRPSTRLPQGGKTSAPPASATSTSNAPAPAPGAGLAALRTRLDALQARQARAAR